VGQARLKQLRDERSELLNKWAQGEGGGAIIKLDWSGSSSPPDQVAQAIRASLNDAAWPLDVNWVLSQVDFKWLDRAADRDRLPGRPSNIASSVWVFNATSLAFGPAFAAKVDGATGLKLARSAVERRNLVAFEFGKMLRQNLQQQSQALLREFQNDADSLPAKLRRLPGVPDLSAGEQDAPSVFGYAFYYFVFDQQTLRRNGAGALVDKWTARPPHEFFSRRN
jgi:hypothetical protein